MRVLVFCEYPSLNGGERSLLEAVRRMSTVDVDVTVAAPSKGPLADALRRYGISHSAFDVFDSTGRRDARPRLRERLAERIHELQPDLVHANSLSMCRLSGPVTQAMNVPSVGHLRDIIRVSRAAITDLNALDQLLAVSRTTARWYIGLGLDPERVEVVHNGVDLDRFQPRPPCGRLRGELRIPPNSILIGSIGQIGMRKGVDLYVAAATRIAARRPDVHFIYVGQRYSQKQEAVEFEDTVRQAATSAPLCGRFHFLGVRDDVPMILNALTVYVHAARQEPLGRVLLEAGAAGTAIVATDVGGTREIFPESSHSAQVVTPESSVALSDGIERVLDDSAERQLMSRNARQRIAAVFAADDASRTLLTWYQRTGARR